MRSVPIVSPLAPVSKPGNLAAFMVSDAQFVICSKLIAYFSGAGSLRTTSRCSAVRSEGRISLSQASHDRYPRQMAGRISFSQVIRAFVVNPGCALRLWEPHTHSFYCMTVELLSALTLKSSWICFSLVQIHVYFFLILSLSVNLSSCAPGCTCSTLYKKMCMQSMTYVCVCACVCLCVCVCVYIYIYIYIYYSYYYYIYIYTHTHTCSLCIQDCISLIIYYIHQLHVIEADIIFADAFLLWHRQLQLWQV
jgi:hypothetical protein